MGGDLKIGKSAIIAHEIVCKWLKAGGQWTCRVIRLDSQDLLECMGVPNKKR